VPTFRLAVWGIPERDLPSSWPAADAPALLAGLRVALTALPPGAVRAGHPCTVEVRTDIGWEPVGWLATEVSPEFLAERAPHWWVRAVLVTRPPPGVTEGR
jgi:hypothetical protein